MRWSRQSSLLKAWPPSVFHLLSLLFGSKQCPWGEADGVKLGLWGPCPSGKPPRIGPPLSGHPQIPGPQSETVPRVFAETPRLSAMLPAFRKAPGWWGRWTHDTQLLLVQQELKEQDRVTTLSRDQKVRQTWALKDKKVRSRRMHEPGLEATGTPGPPEAQ